MKISYVVIAVLMLVACSEKGEKQLLPFVAQCGFDFEIEEDKATLSEINSLVDGIWEPKGELYHQAMVDGVQRYVKTGFGFDVVTGKYGRVTFLYSDTLNGQERDLEEVKKTKVVYDTILISKPIASYLDGSYRVVELHDSLGQSGLLNCSTHVLKVDEQGRLNISNGVSLFPRPNTAKKKIEDELKQSATQRWVPNIYYRNDTIPQ